MYIFLVFVSFASEKSRIFQGGAEPRLIPADHIFVIEVCFVFGIIHVDQLKAIVIHFWISSRVFF